MARAGAAPLCYGPAAMRAAFPSLVIRSDALVPQGAYAQAQAEYLQPDEDTVARLGALLREANAGVVAHFYMDPELQGVLSATEWPHVHISDSLKMADAAVKMAQAGVGTIVVLGVDFMSENVRAMLTASGFGDVPVYRVAHEPIGCSLATAAEAPTYGAYLQQAAHTPDALHVIYVNTSLRTKAQAEALVPTITCTSSNVIATILQAAAQVPEVEVFYGPDTYMGHNLRRYFEQLATMSAEAVAAVHPDHTPATITGLLGRYHCFEQGVCIVHHMFGADVARRVHDDYGDAFVTAHLEVPGEMFELGLAAQNEGRGVVGLTAEILAFITARVKAAVARRPRARLRFVLGTEAGMITSIVRAVQSILREHPDAGVEAEIVFPVASEAITRTAELGLGVVPGAAAGEGCSVAGGCATCPYMKMNSLDGLLGVLGALRSSPETLRPFRPHEYVEAIAGRTIADLGGTTILHMRHFQRTGLLSDALVEDIRTRHARRAADAG